MKQGNLLWLLAHDVRIEYRELRGKAGAGTWLVLALLLAGLHWLWSLLILGMGPQLNPDTEPMLGSLLLLLLLPAAIILGLNQSIRTVFERNDLDLLLGSPLPARTVFASRLLGIVLYVFLTMGFFVLPAVTIGLLLGMPRLLGLVPTLLAVALTGSAVGMVLTLVLVRIMGPRRARVFSQMLGAIGGAVLLLATQVPLLIRSGGEGEGLAGLAERVVQLLQPGALLGPDSLLWLPGRAVFLDPLVTPALLLLAVVLLAGTVLLLHRSFSHGTAAALTAAPARRRGRNADSLSFGRSSSLWRVMLAKEWRLLSRDPYLLSQTLLQLVYLVPLGIVMFVNRDGELIGTLGLVMSAGLVFLASTLAASLTRICFGGEEAMDLLLAAPVSGRTLRRVKLIAALLPVWILTVPLGVALLFLQPRYGLVALPLLLAATLAVAVVRLNNPIRARRHDLFKRHNQGDQVLVLIEGILPLAWGAAAWLLGSGSNFYLIALAAGVLLPFVARQRGVALGAGYAEAGLE